MTKLSLNKLAALISESKKLHAETLSRKDYAKKSSLCDSLRLCVFACAFVFGFYLSPVFAQPKSSSRGNSTVAAQLPSRDSLAVKALRAAPGKASLYEVSFVTMDSLAANATIVISFPKAFDLSRLEIAGSSTINGGFTLARNGQDVQVRRTGLGAKISPGKKVSIQLGLIGNPTSFSASHQVRVQLPATRNAAATTKNMDVQFITSVK